jgi:hypothetical protein
MAMEFAKTAATRNVVADDSWMPEGTQEFFVIR